jgi:hypothetical protein
MTENGPDLSALAADMLKWERMKRACDELEQAIKDTVLQLEKTQTVGNVRATYSGGRKTYDYWGAAAASGAADDPDIVGKYSEWITDWRRLCKEEEISEIPYTQSSPSVSLRLLA